MIDSLIVVELVVEHLVGDDAGVGVVAAHEGEDGVGVEAVALHTDDVVCVAVVGAFDHGVYICTIMTQVSQRSYKIGDDDPRPTLL